MASKSKGGGLSTVQAIFALLVIFGACGGYLKWNFEEKEEFRPFGSYSDEAVDQLAESFGAEFERLDGQYRQLADRKVDVQHHALLGDRVREFERVQAVAEQTRKAGHQVSFVMADQKNLKREMWIRAHPFQHFWDTATVF